MSSVHQTMAILFADIAGSTRLYEQIGDVEAHRQVSDSLARMARAVAMHRGEVLRTVGDSTLASFACCDDALEAAVQMQTMHQQSPLALRTGFHFGSVIPDKGDVYGNAVNIAARVASFARTGEIVTTGSSVGGLSERNRQRVSLLDSVTVKGIVDPVEVYRIAWEHDVEQHTQIAPASRQSRRAANDTLELQLGQRHISIDERTPELTIGRDAGCGIVLDGDRVSRQHARLEWRAGQVILTDESTNGTFVSADEQPALFVRRESIVLSGEGVIGFGEEVGPGNSHAALFRVCDDD